MKDLRNLELCSILHNMKAKERGESRCVYIPKSLLDMGKPVLSPAGLSADVQEGLEVVWGGRLAKTDSRPVSGRNSGNVADEEKRKA